MATGSAGDSWAKRSARWSFGGSSTPGPDAPGARFPGYADALGRALAELDGALLDADDLDEPLASFVRAYRDELDRLDAWDRGMLRRRAHRAADRRPRVVGRQPGARARLRGPHRRRVAAPRGARGAHRRPRLAAVRAGPRRRTPRSRGRPRDLAALADDDIVELPPRAAEYLPPALAHVERELFAPTSGARAARRRRSASSREPGTRGTLELVAEEALAAIRAGIAPDEIAVVCPSLDAITRPARDGVRRARRPRWRSRVGRRSARRRSGTRSSRSFASPGSAASDPSSTRTCARRTRGSSGARWTGSRESCAAAASCAATARSRSPPSSAVGARSCSSTARSRTSHPSRRCARSARRCSGTPTASSPRRSARGRGRTSPPTTPSPARSTSSMRSRAQAGRSAARDVLAALDRASVPGERAGRAGPGRRPRPPAGAHAALRHRVRARARAGDAPAPRPRRAVPRRGLAPQPRGPPRRPPRAARSGEPRPVPLRDRVHPAAATARARAPGGRRRGHAARAEPVLGGGARALRRGRRSPPDPPPAALRADPGHRGGSDRPGAPARPRPCRRDASPPRPRRSPRRTAGTGVSVGRHAPSTGRRASRTSARCSSWEAGTPTRCPTSSGWRRARRRGSSSATSGPGRSTGRSTGCSAARSSTARCSASTSSCRARSREPTG